MVQKDLCSLCYKKILPLVRQCCPHCRVPSFLGAVCKDCLPLCAALEGLYVATIFRDTGVLQAAVHALKYAGRRSLVRQLCSIGADLASFTELSLHLRRTGAVLLPVPLAAQRLQERGFNQAADLAEAYGTLLGVSVQKGCLYRQRATKSQARLSREERRINVQDAFSCNGPAPPVVLLIDDVATTLSTLQACATALRQHGTQHVSALVLARAL